MYQLKIGSIPLPKLYVVDDRAEAVKCRKLGVPYIIKPVGWDDDRLIKAVLWKTLNDKFPYIDWRRLFDMTNYQANKTVHVPEEVELSSDTREFCDSYLPFDTSPDLVVTEDREYREVFGGTDEDIQYDWHEENIDAYIGDIGYHVNIEELQQLRLLPTFLDDIANAIKTNIMNTSWMDGYNKKLGCNLGSWKGSEQAPNLIILDVSGSIPQGVSATMVTLIDTLRNQANADLIITSKRSKYYPANEDLPNNKELSILIGGCNECIQFYEILRNHILGKHWGNVIVFGDWDSPLRSDIQRQATRTNGTANNIRLEELQNTTVDNLLAFHTHRDEVPGYGLWVKDACPKVPITYCTNWVSYMKD